MRETRSSRGRGGSARGRGGSVRGRGGSVRGRGGSVRGRGGSARGTTKTPASEKKANKKKEKLETAKKNSVARGGRIAVDLPNKRAELKKLDDKTPPLEKKASKKKEKRLETANKNLVERDGRIAVDLPDKKIELKKLDDKNIGSGDIKFHSGEESAQSSVTLDKANDQNKHQVGNQHAVSSKRGLVKNEKEHEAKKDNSDVIEDEEVLRIIADLEEVVNDFPELNELNEASGTKRSDVEKPSEVEPEKPSNVKPEKPSDVKPEKHSDVQPRKPCDVKSEKSCGVKVRKLSNVKSEKSSGVEPQKPSDIEPEKHSDVKPEKPSDVKSEKSSGIEPRKPSNVKSEKSSGVEPEIPSDVEPEKHSGVEPEKPCDVEPEKHFDVKPEKHSGVEPEKPSDVEPEKHSDVKPEKHSGVEPEKHSGVELEKPSDVEPEKPSDFEPEKSSDFEPEKSSVVEPGKPSDVEPEKPDVEAGKPSDGKPEKPSDVEAEKSDVEPRKPSDVEPEKSSDVEPGKPSDVEPEKPYVEPGKPSDIKPDKPSDVEPRKPSDIEPDKSSDVETKCNKDRGKEIKNIVKSLENAKKEGKPLQAKEVGGLTNHGPYSRILFVGDSRMQSLEDFWPEYPYIKPQFLIDPHLKLEGLKDFILSRTELPRLENGTLLICNVGLYDIIELVDFGNCASVRNHKPLKIMTLTENGVEDLVRILFFRLDKAYKMLEDILGSVSVICFSAIIPCDPIMHFFAQARNHFPRGHTSMSFQIRENLDMIRSKIRVICTKVNKHLETRSRMPSIYKIMSSYHLNYNIVGQAFDDGLNVSVETSRLLAARLNKFLIELFYGVEISTNFVNYKRDKKVVVVGDSRMMMLREIWHGDRPQFYCEPNLGFYNFSKFINRKLVDLKDKIVIVCLGLNDLIQFVNNESCIGKHHKPCQVALSLCEKYGSTEEYFKKIHDDFKSSFSLFCSKTPALMYFATVYPIHINNYMNSQMKIHKEKTGHVITPSQMKPEVNAKLNELVHWLNSLIKDVCREHGLPLWDMFHVVCRGYEASATRQYVLKDGIYPSERIAEELNRSFFPFARGKLIQKFCENVKEYNFLYRPLPTCSDYPTNKIWPKNVDSKLSTEKTQRGVHQLPLKKTEASKPTNEKIKMGYASENKEAPKILSPSQSSGALNYEKSKTLKEEKKGPIKEESNPVVSKHPESQKHVDDAQRQIPEISCPKGSYEKSKTLEEEKKGPTKEGTNSDISKYPGSQKQVDVWQRLSPKISFPKGSYEKSKTLEEEKKGPTKEGTNSDIPKYPGSQKQVAVWQRLSPKISFPKGSYEKSKTLEEEKKGPIKEGTNSDISKYPGSQKHADVRQRLSPKISFPKGSYQKSKTLNEEKEGPTKEVTKSNISKHPESQKYVDDRQKQSPETSCPQGRSVGLAVKGAINCCLYHCEQSKTLKEEKKGPTKEETNSDISKHPESQKQRPSPETSFPQRSYKKIKISKEENEGPPKEEESSDKSKHPESQSQSPGISFPKAGYKKSKNLEEEKKGPTKEETKSDIYKHPEKQKHVDDKQKQRPETSFPKGRSVDLAVKSALNCCLYHCEKSKTLKEETKGPTKEETNSDISKHPESQKQRQSPETSYSQRSYKKMKISKEKNEGPTKEETNADKSKHPESQKHVHDQQRHRPETSYPQGSYKKLKISKEENEGPTKEETNSNKSKHPESQKHVHDQQRHRPETSYPQGSYEKNKTLEEEKKDPTKEGTNSDISKYPESKKHVDVRQRPSPEISFPKGSYEKSKTLKEEKKGLKEEKKDPTKEGTNSDISKHPESQRHVDTRERQSPGISFPKRRSHQPDTDTSVSCVEAKKHSSNPVHRRLSPKDDRLSPFTRSEDRGPGFHTSEKCPGSEERRYPLPSSERHPLSEERRYPLPSSERHPRSEERRYPVPSPEERRYPLPSPERLPHSDERYPLPSPEWHSHSEDRRYPLPSSEGHPYPEERRYPLPLSEGHPNPEERRYPLPSPERHPYSEERRYPLPSSERHPYAEERRYPLPSSERQPHSEERRYPLPLSERSRLPFHERRSWSPMYTGRSRSPEHYSERGREDRESYYNLDEAPWSKIGSALEAFTESNRRIRKQCQKEKDPIFRDALVDLFSTHAHECELYLAKPDAHPDYCKEYRLFLDKKRDFIMSLGGDPETYDYIKEWGKIWPSRMYDLFQESWEARKKQCLSMISSKRKRSSSSSSSSRSPTPERVRKRSKKKASKPEKSLPKPETEEVVEDTKDMMLSRKETEKLRERNEQSQCMPDGEKVSSSHNVGKKKVVKIVEVLGVLTYMKDRLGVFGVPVSILYEKAVEMEKRGLNPNALLEDEETAVLFATLSNKLSSSIKEGDGSAIQKAITLEAHTLLLDLIAEINKIKKKHVTNFCVNVAKIACLTIGKTISDTITTIKYFLVYEGYSNVSKEDLENIYMSVKDEQLKLTESTASSQNCRSPSSPSGFDRTEQKTVESKRPGQGLTNFFLPQNELSEEFLRTKSSPSRDVGLSKPMTVKASTSKFDTPVELDEEFFTGKKFLRPSDSVDSSRTEVTLKPHKHKLPPPAPTISVIHSSVLLKNSSSQPVQNPICRTPVHSLQNSKQ